ncbi:conserved Plasmodium protein, unknown function [Plasmodium chabaudi chabaudi]|uniref:Uncharacterized protein n=2 Tax=Plasmodium chabaudi TaxID=5825 RepID=A0A077TKN3_PLACU|nr:conserved Plasmodium protein, unknown function [Plasmodium chabaudi chabaudi]SCM22318.1 conserved Plasmodium protein, unknown function [Plasmodium chabaudi adami]SCM23592.1 conserved Plasmodium protein, unknown function [Plasmodium chabaudi chabaudi]SCN61060.1 conserved Plasmodium protein, unknown function [Plasmodium chabaudi chabaudi]VTZ69147.1 conserved Plasmodium protein, unknown function [Plasmodium chabaudi chabaudi]|eukprot:XP_016653963.1 conserved Plasmodium protein, unknown function [Plasmodium chabaudi chabaudi]
MSYGWLTESTIFGKKEKTIQLEKDKLFNENKHNPKNENSIDKLNSIVNSYLKNIKENKKNPINKKKLSYHEKIYNEKNEGVEKRNKQDKEITTANKKINKEQKYEKLQKKGSNNPKYLVDFELKKEMELEMEKIRKLKENQKAKNWE